MQANTAKSIAKNYEVVTAVIEWTDAILPTGEWFITTCFDTLLFYDADNGELRHEDVAIAPRNLVVRSDPGHAKLFWVDLKTTKATDLTEQFRVSNAGQSGCVALLRGQQMLTANPNGMVTKEAQRLMSWETFKIVSKSYLEGPRYWQPLSPRGGTQLMQDRLAQELKGELFEINLKINTFSLDDLDERPLVLWLHNQPNPLYDWCHQIEYVSRVAKFVFVSNWQRQAFVDRYALPPCRCDVIRNAILIEEPIRSWPDYIPWRWRCAYISAPDRGLSVLIDSWNDLSPSNAELHVWSGRTLWRFDDHPYRSLFGRAMETPGVHFHRIAPNDVIRSALRDMHFLLYPNVYPETSCLSAVEAMCAGCRIIAPSHAALPETTAGFARLYPFSENRDVHKALFLNALKEEFDLPWGGRADLSLAEQKYCREIYSLSSVVTDWRRLIRMLALS